jgi:hypothetical protein
MFVFDTVLTEFITAVLNPGYKRKFEPATKAIQHQDRGLETNV